MAKDLFEFLRRTRKNCFPEEVDHTDEGFPLEEVYYAKTYTFRLDTLIAFSVFFLFLLVTAFFLGRLSVPVPPEQKRSTPSLALQKVVVLPKEEKQLEKTLPEKKEQEKKEEKTSKEGIYHIQVLSSPTRKGALEVVEFLKTKGFPHSYVVKRGRHYMVRIPGFEKKDPKVLEKVRKLRYKGRYWFDSAFYIRRRG